MPPNPSEYDPEFWTCPYCKGNRLGRLPGDSYRLRRSMLFKCDDCRQLITERALRGLRQTAADRYAIAQLSITAGDDAVFKRGRLAWRGSARA
jgi:hypothetical protein